MQDFAKHLPFIYIRCSQNPLPSQPRLLFSQEHNDEDAGNTNVTPNADSNVDSSNIFSPFRAAALASTIEERHFLCSLGSPALAEFFQSQNIDPSQMGNGALTFTGDFVKTLSSESSFHAEFSSDPELLVRSENVLVSIHACREFNILQKVLTICTYIEEISKLFLTVPLLCPSAEARRFHEVAYFELLEELQTIRLASDLKSTLISSFWPISEYTSDVTNILNLLPSNLKHWNQTNLVALLYPQLPRLLKDVLARDDCYQPSRPIRSKTDVIDHASSFFSCLNGALQQLELSQRQDRRQLAQLLSELNHQSSLSANVAPFSQVSSQQRVAPMRSPYSAPTGFPALSAAAPPRGLPQAEQTMLQYQSTSTSLPPPVKRARTSTSFPPPPPPPQPHLSSTDSPFVYLIPANYPPPDSSAIASCQNFVPGKTVPRIPIHFRCCLFCFRLGHIFKQCPIVAHLSHTSPEYIHARGVFFAHYRKQSDDIRASRSQAPPHIPGTIGVVPVCFTDTPTSSHLCQAPVRFSAKMPHLAILLPCQKTLFAMIDTGAGVNLMNSKLVLLLEQFCPSVIVASYLASDPDLKFECLKLGSISDTCAVDIDRVIVVDTEIFSHSGSRLFLHFGVSNDSSIPAIFVLVSIWELNMNLLLSEGFLASADYNIPFRFQLISNLLFSTRFTNFFQATAPCHPSSSKSFPAEFGFPIVTTNHEDAVRSVQFNLPSFDSYSAPTFLGDPSEDFLLVCASLLPRSE